MDILQKPFSIRIFELSSRFDVSVTFSCDKVSEKKYNNIHVKQTDFPAENCIDCRFCTTTLQVNSFLDRIAEYALKMI